MSIQDAPIREDIQPMPGVWSIWFKNLVKAVNGVTTAITSAPLGFILFGDGSGIQTDSRLTFDGTLLNVGVLPDNASIDPTRGPVLNGTSTVWNDINTSIIPPAGLLASPTVIAFNGDARLDIYGFSGTAVVPDEIHASLEVLHDYKEGTDIHFHLHWYPTNATVANVKWQFRYSWFNPGTIPPAGQTASVVVATSGVAWQEQTSAIVLSGTGMKMGSRLVYTLFRDAQDAQDTYAFNAAVSDMGIHYEIDTMGSREILVK